MNHLSFFFVFVSAFRSLYSFPMTVIKIVLIERTFAVTSAAVLLQYKIMVIVCVRSAQGLCDAKQMVPVNRWYLPTILSPTSWNVRYTI